MGRSRSQPQPQPPKTCSRKRKQDQEQMGMDAANKRHSSGVNGGIDKLPDDILINILSHLNIKEASRASVLAPRWRNIWRFSHGILRFDNRDTAAGAPMEMKEFESCVNTVAEHHQGPKVEGVVISFDSGRDMDLIKSNKFRGAKSWLYIRYKRCPAFESWVSFASRKEVERLELSFSLRNGYKFPSVASLMSISHGLCCLRILRLAYVDVEDDVVQYFLASCSNLEELRIRFSYETKNIRVIDPPSLRVLEISRCFKIQSLEISSAGLVSLTYGGGKRSLQLKKIPNLRELNICDDFCTDFIVEPKEHWSYSAQLEKLVLDFRLLHEDGVLDVSTDLPRLCSLKRLEVQVLAEDGIDLLFVTTLIKGSPLLREFRIEMFHSVNPLTGEDRLKPFPGLESETALGEIVVPKVGKYAHKNLKAVEINGYIGCSSDEKLVKALIQIGRPSLERVAIDTESDYYDSRELKSFIAVQENFFPGTWCPHKTGTMARDEAKEGAKKLVSKLPRRIKFIVT